MAVGCFPKGMCIGFRVAVSRVFGGNAAQGDTFLEGSLLWRLRIGQMFLSQALIGRRAGLAVIALHQRRSIGQATLLP